MAPSEHGTCRRIDPITAMNGGGCLAHAERIARQVLENLAVQPAIFTHQLGAETAFQPSEHRVHIA